MRISGFARAVSCRPAAAAGIWMAALALLAALAGSARATASEFASPGGPAPANLDEIAQVLRQDPYDLELLISFGTSKGGSAGHLALAIRDGAADDDRVHSANFYADRDPAHAGRYYTRELVLGIPKKEYLYGTSSSLGELASFGLDFGEVYKRSVVGVRVYGVPAAEKQALAAFFARVNADYRARAGRTDYHDDEIKYGYLHLNCAKTIGMGFRQGAGYRDVEVSSARLLSGRRVVAAANANVPTEMALKLMKAWHARGYGMDVVLYKKYAGSDWIDPREEDKVALKDLPDRFPSVLSRDFRSQQGQYRDYDNLFAMYLLFNLGKASVKLNEETKLLEIEKSKSPMAYAEAAVQAAQSAKSDSAKYRRRVPFLPRGTLIGETPDNTHLYHYEAGDKKKTAP